MRNYKPLRWTAAKKKYSNLLHGLGNSDWHYRMVFEQSPVAMLCCDAAGKVISMNSSAQDLYGVSNREALSDYFLLAETFMTNEVLAQLTAGEKVHFCAAFDFGNVPYPTKRIGLCHCELLIIPVLLGSAIVAYIAQIRDINDRYEAERTLSENEARFRMLAENSIDIIWAMDKNAHFTYISPAVQSLLQYSAAEIQQLDYHDLLSPESTKKLADNLKEVLNGTYHYHPGESLEIELRSKSGEYIWCELHWRPIYDIYGQINGIQGTCRDIRERRVLEQQLVQAQKMEAIGILAGGIAHDFNNLLTAIIGSTSLARMEEASESVAQELEQVYRAAERAAELVRQLLLFARKTDAKRQSLDLRPLVKGTVKFLAQTLDRRIEISVQADNDLGLVFADPSQIHQVLMNLCGNACDAIAERFDGPGSNSGDAHTYHITITLANVVVSPEQARLHVGAKPGDYICLSVGDDGIGMNKEVLRHLFEPFFTTKEVHRGTGLGLPTVYGIIAQHGGWIDVESNYGEGSTFKVYLTRYQNPSQTKASDNLFFPLGTENGQILFVDDEAAISQLAKKVLERAGYSVVIAADGEEALRIFREQHTKLALVILDLNMPRLSGEDCYWMITQIDNKVPIIVSSGNGEANNTSLPDSVSYLAKPFRADEMLALTHEVIARHPLACS